jgi:hypothetical protein
MKGINIAEQCHVVNILGPRDADTVATPEVFSMRQAGHVSIILGLGVTGAAITVTVEACDNFTPSTTSAIAFSYYPQTTATGDVIGARTAATTSGFATTTNDVVFYVIEIDASELPAGFPCLQLKLSDPGAATFAYAVALLSGNRYGVSPTAIA